MGILATSSLGGNIFKLKLNYYTFAAVLNDNQGKKVQLILTGETEQAAVRCFYDTPKTQSITYCSQHQHRCCHHYFYEEKGRLGVFLRRKGANNRSSLAFREI